MRITNFRTRIMRLIAGSRKRRPSKLAAAVLTGGMLFSGVADGADIVGNGGFETPNSVWTNQGGDYAHPYGGINGPQLTAVGTISTYGFFDNISADAGGSFHGLARPTTQTQSLVNADLTAQQILDGEGRFEFSSWLATCCGDNPKVTATFDDALGTTFSLNRGLAFGQVTTADILVNPGGAENATSQGVGTDASRRYWALYEAKGRIPTDATEVTIAVDDGRADAGIGSGNGNDNYADMVIFDAVQSTQSVELTLEVNKTTGALTIINDQVAVDEDVNFYEVFSSGDSGTLNTGWNSLADQMIDSLGGNPEDNWQEGGASANRLTEAFLLGSTDLTSGGTSVTMTSGYSGGNGGAEDLVFRYGTTDGALKQGFVTYITSAALPGDYDGSGTVDAADYALWRENLGDGDESAFAAGTGNGGGIDSSDYTFWKERFGDTSAPGAAQSTSTPEPGALLLMASALGLVSVGSRSRKNS